MNADQAERDRLVQFGEDSVPRLLPGDAFGAMPMSWTIVRHYVSQCLRAGGAPIDTPWGTDRGTGQRIMDAGLMKEEMPLFTTPVCLREKAMLALITAMYVGDGGPRVTRCAGTKALGVVRRRVTFEQISFEVRDHRKPLRVAYVGGAAITFDASAAYYDGIASSKKNGEGRCRLQGDNPDVESFRIRRCVLQIPQRRKPPTRVGPKQPRVHRSPI